MTTTATKPRTRRTRRTVTPKTRVKTGRPSGAYVIECNGDELFTVRGFSGMTQQRLADRAGVTRTTITNLETGLRTSCSLEVATRIAKALGQPADKLFTLRKLEA